MRIKLQLRDSIHCIAVDVLTIDTTGTYAIFLPVIFDKMNQFQFKNIIAGSMLKNTIILD